MLTRTLQLLIFISLFSFGAVCAAAQSADSNRPTGFPGTDKDDRPTSIKEMFVKMRIAKDKKDHQEMIDRGEEVLRIAQLIDKNFTANAHLSDDDRARLATIEDDLKKIRNELGGKNDDEPLNENRADVAAACTVAFKEFRSKAEMLVDELKKTTRFTISAAAIETTNTVMKLARFLRITRN
jgi:hypothetical protein